ncbi:MAG: gliding motility-associated C-terminal domain-containing protein, partial [Chitinophagaceae bacterium]|nr:gliding motility-associated C-terminal domain-containing protein [Chitinophagaceae bacterium]
YSITAPGVINASTGAITALCAGTYTVTVTDANLCTATTSFTITEPIVLTANVVAGTAPSCTPGCDGTAQASGTGGTLAYTYSIAGGATIDPNTGAITAICAGVTYTITVTDANNCVSTTTINMTTPGGPVLSLNTSANPSCTPGCDGTATFNLVGGSAPYNFTISPSGTINPGTGDASALCDGITYTITVTDVNSCVGTITVLLTAPAGPTVSVASTTDASCVPGCDGTATMNSVGGTPGYTYTIAPAGPVIAANVISGLCAGTIYTVTSTDASACFGTITVQIGTTPSPTVTVTTQNNVTIAGLCNGDLTVTGAGGTPGYTYTIAPAGPVQGPVGTFTGLCAVCYTITITDASGCTNTTSTCITEPGVFNLAVSHTDESCAGVCDGTITALANGGVAPFNYSLNGVPNAPITSGNWTNLCPGTYTVQAGDANGATLTSVVTIIGPTAIVFNIPTVTQPSCNPGCDGTIGVVANGGSGAITYAISNITACGETQTTAGNFTNIGANSYTIIATDANGCTGSTVINVTTLNGPAITSVNLTNVSCFGACDGSIVVNATSPNGGLQYSIGGAFQASNTFNGVCAGAYVVTVTDAGGCSAQSNVNITEPAAFQILANTSTNINCFGANNGTITFNVGGGSGVFNYNLNPGSVPSATGNYTGLGANVYTVVATDAGSGCTISATFTITQPPLLTIPSVVVQNTLCSGTPNGTITINANGGTPNYTYTLNPSSGTQVDSFYSGVQAGTYTATVTDANGCTATTIINLLGPAPLVFNTVIGTNPTCNASCNGSIVANAIGGTAPLNYTITGGSFTNLCANTYTITVTDANGCTNTTSVTLTDPQVLSITNVVIVDPTCNGLCNGSITVTATGGTGALQYGLTPGGTNATGIFNGLCSNSYVITVTDANGCSVTTNANVANPAALVWTTTTSTNVSCAGANNGTITTLATGGTGTITYTLLPGPISNTTGNFSPLGASTYTVNAVDASGCSVSTTFVISEPPVLTMNPPVSTNLLCFGDNSGTISTSANGGTPGYTYTINPVIGTQPTPGDFIGLTAGTYTITGTDASGCTATTTATINQPPALQFTQVNVQNVPCFGTPAGSITVTALGGSGNIVFTLTPFNPPATQGPSGFFSGLYAGNYVITATDGNGCSITTAVTVTENPPITVTNLILTEPICNGDANGSIEVTATGGVAPIQYSLNGTTFQNSGLFINLIAGNYFLTMRDALGCIRDTVITLTQPEPVGAILDIRDALCVDSEDGKAYIIGTGGRGGYKYYLTPGLYINKSGIFNGLPADTYTLRVVDTAGCEYSTIFVINPPANPLNNNFSKQDLACNGKGNEGQATAIVAGGAPPYSFLWSTVPAQTTATATTLYYGTYYVDITDANGCVIKDTVYIEEGPCCDVAFIPNAFSPNGDRNNDEFKVLTTAGVELIQLEVYDRWGKRVWSTNDYRRGWDGIYEGKDCPVATYYYVFRYKCTRDGSNYIKKGDLTLIR